MCSCAWSVSTAARKSRASRHSPRRSRWKPRRAQARSPVLFHGLGFAGGLSDAGLPAGHIPTALLFFSLGVEAGHFLFIGAVLSFIALMRRIRIPFPQWTELVPPYAIGTVAMCWLIQRIGAF